jgi:hypothetical protein
MQVVLFSKLLPIFHKSISKLVEGLEVKELELELELYGLVVKEEVELEE